MIGRGGTCRTTHDEIARVHEERDRVSDRLRRLGTAFVDGLFPDQEYRRQKLALESRLESLVVSEVDSAEEAGRLVGDLPDASARTKNRV